MAFENIIMEKKDLNTAITLELRAATSGGTLGATTEGMAAFVEKKKPEF